jgi:HD-GYP domain-containing protein (c-di-GMP phosphodiesterase class II)
MIRRLRTPLFDLVMCFSSALDLVYPAMTDHHKRVAYIASSIAAEMGMSRREESDLLVAGAFHDSGALTLKEKIDMLRFELEAPHLHAELGHDFLKRSSLFCRVAPLVRFHHVPWRGGEGSRHRGLDVPLGSHILHAADRMAVLIRKDSPVLGQVGAVYRKMEEDSGLLFHPEVVSAALRSARKEAFWLDTVSPFIERTLCNRAHLPVAELDEEGLLDLAKFFGRVIDFRSTFTAVHSSGAAAVAEALAVIAGLSQSECFMMRIAGYLHDLGKLAIPTEILEKPGKLTEEETHIVRAHSYHTFRILEPIRDFETINQWASFHHERLDGNGYPFHHRGADIPFGSRILAVADVFTAITEDRPYRAGMDFSSALKVLESMASNASLDARIVGMLTAHFDEVHALRVETQAAAQKEFEEFEGRKVAAPT